MGRTHELTALRVTQHPGHLVWEVTVGLEPVCMVSGGVSEPPELHRYVGPNCCLSYSLFRHTHTHGCGLPVGIL